MFFFGHLGITAGIVKVGDAFSSRAQPDNDRSSTYDSEINTASARRRLKLSRWFRNIKSRMARVDYRLVLLGSLLPDVIDKPVFLLTGNFLPLSGRGYTHTLLFSLVLLAGGLALLSRRKSWLLVISLSSFMHLILDEMWNIPVTLFWPLLGPVPSAETTDWLQNTVAGVFQNPEVYVPEIIGLAIMLLFAYSLVKRKGIIGFVKKGTVA